MTNRIVFAGQGATVRLVPKVASASAPKVTVLSGKITGGQVTPQAA